jgi:cytochrome c oxidase subunit 2
VLHSFWVPAFRVKIDAVPGRTTHVYVSIEREGSYETDSGLRVQCAELCGMDHGAMALPIRVLPRAEFDAWLAEHQAATTSTTSDGTAGTTSTTGTTA